MVDFFGACTTRLSGTRRGEKRDGGEVGRRLKHIPAARRLSWLSLTTGTTMWYPGVSTGDTSDDGRERRVGIMSGKCKRCRKRDAEQRVRVYALRRAHTRRPACGASCLRPRPPPQRGFEGKNTAQEASCRSGRQRNEQTQWPSARSQLAPAYPLQVSSKLLYRYTGVGGFV